MGGTHDEKNLSVVPCSVLTVSDTRREEDDVSGQKIKSLLASAGHRVVSYHILPDDSVHIRKYIKEVARGGDCAAVLASGGTGLAPRDRTVEALEELFEKRLDGFGALFRMLSYEQIGAKAMLSRAVAGTYEGILVFLMPGSPAAVELALEKLILPTLPHAAALMRG